IEMVFRGDLHAVVVDERNVLLELVDAVGPLDDDIGMHAGAVDGLWTLDVQAELHQLCTDSVTNVQCVLDRGIHPRVTWRVDRDIQFEIETATARSRFDLSQMLGADVVVEVDQGDVQY